MSTRNTVTHAANGPSVPDRLAKLKTDLRNTDAYWIEAAKDAASDAIYAEMCVQKVTRAELARRLGKSPAYVSKVLGGGENLTIETLVKISRALGHNEISWIFTGALSREDVPASDSASNSEVKRVLRLDVRRPLSSPGRKGVKAVARKRRVEAVKSLSK